MKISALDNLPAIEEVGVQGKPLSKDLQSMLLAIDLEMGIDQVTEITLMFDDPAFELLKSEQFKLNAHVAYRGLHLYVAVIETNEGGGLGGLAVRCRPIAVRKLKRLRGHDVLKQITPANYLRAQCKQAGVTKPPVAQTSAVKKRIARDTAEKGTTPDPENYPSAWTTMKRLAGEKGYYLYEVGGTIYFGQPTWLVRQHPAVEVDWYPEGAKEPLTIPTIRHSVDSRDLEVGVELPIRRAGGVLPGVGLKLTNFRAGI